MESVVSTRRMGGAQCGTNAAQSGVEGARERRRQRKHSRRCSRHLILPPLPSIEAEEVQLGCGQERGRQRGHGGEVLVLRVEIGIGGIEGGSQAAEDLARGSSEGAQGVGNGADPSAFQSSLVSLEQTFALVQRTSKKLRTSSRRG